MKKIALALSALMLVFTIAACSKSTKLEIVNGTSFALTNISYRGTAFDTLQTGNSDTQEVDAGSDYIFFTIVIPGASVALRTTFMVKTESHETTSFTFTDNTLVTRQAGEAGSRSIGAASVALGSLK